MYIAYSRDGIEGSADPSGSSGSILSRSRSKKHVEQFISDRCSRRPQESMAGTTVGTPKQQREPSCDNKQANLSRNHRSVGRGSSWFPTLSSGQLQSALHRPARCDMDYRSLYPWTASAAWSTQDCLHCQADNHRNLSLIKSKR